MPSRCLFCTNTARASGSARCSAISPAVCVPLANFKLGAAASKLARMFYSLMTMPDSADITVCTQWHLWSIPFLQAFPNTPPGMHKNCSHLRHRGSGLVHPFHSWPRHAPCTAAGPSAWAWGQSSPGASQWRSDGVCWLVRGNGSASVIRPGTPSLEKLFVSPRGSLLV